jgi:hypothetical protein
MRCFSQYACADWSGAISERPTGIAIAIADRSGPPRLISPIPRWSRLDVRDWLLALANAQTDIVIGFDMSFGFPYADQGAYFPQWPESPPNAKSLWAMVDDICKDDPHLSAASFVNHPDARRHFRHGKGDQGDLFGESGVGRLRRCELHQRATKQGNSASCFNLVGASQVGKSSLTGMRMLHQLQGRIPVWPFDPVPEKGPLIVEIYTSMAARSTGLPPGRSKVRDHAGLIAALTALGSPSLPRLAAYDDHSTDAIMTAAWMRNSTQNQGLWNPEKLNLHIGATEGWTFGII